jgi:hypothetical protein
LEGKKMDGIVSYWEARPEWLRWVLFLPVFALLTPLVGMLAMLVLRFSNAHIWSAWLSSLLQGPVFGYVPFRLAHWLAPRFKPAVALCATSPILLLAVLTVINVAADLFALRPGWAGEPIPRHEGLWGIACLFSIALAIMHSRKRSAASIGSNRHE